MQEPPDYKSYFAILKRVASSDGVYCDRERNMLLAIAHNMGVDQDAAVLEVIESEAMPGKGFLDTERNAVSAGITRAAIRDALLVSIADGKYSEDEDSVIRSLCRDFKLSDEFFQRAKDWAERYCDILQEGQQLFA